MFCPNCATPDEEAQHYCRSCGLNLDAITASVAEQMPSAEIAELLNRKKLFERLGKYSLSIAAIVGFMLATSLAIHYKLILLGPELLYGSALGALVLFGLLSIFFLNYPKIFMSFNKTNRRLSPQKTGNHLSAPTGKLLDDSKPEPASVTEDSTELLTIRRKE